MTSEMHRCCFSFNIKKSTALEIVVRARGLEPTFGVFSGLLIDAFLCELSPDMKQQIPNKNKHNFATMGKHMKNYLCDFVRQLRRCAVTVR